MSGTARWQWPQPTRSCLLRASIWLPRKLWVTSRRLCPYSIQSMGDRNHSVSMFWCFRNYPLNEQIISDIKDILLDPQDDDFACACLLQMHDNAAASCLVLDLLFYLVLLLSLGDIECSITCDNKYTIYIYFIRNVITEITFCYYSNIYD